MMPAASTGLRDLVRAAERVATDASLDELAARLRDCRAARDHPGVRVAVVGDVNRGKSTLVNRLIGVDLLPTGSVPLTREIVMVRSDDGSAAGSGEPGLVLLAPSEWLAEAEVEVIDTPGLHEGRADHLQQTRRAVEVSDVVVMAISAPSPLSLLERQFLEDELLAKRVPHVMVALTRIDQLPLGEAADFLAWFQARVAEVSPRITAVAGPGLAPGGTRELDRLRDRISDLAHSGDLIRRRDLRLAWQLTDACAAIRSAAQLANAQLSAEEASHHAAVQTLKEQLAEDDLGWTQLRLSLEERRQRLATSIGEQVTAATSELYERLDVELDRISDVKAWWDRELKSWLRHDLKKLTLSLEAQVSAAIARDFNWLEAAAARMAGTAGAGGKPPGPRAMAPISLGDQQGLELDDLRRHRMISRVAASAGGIVGAAIAFITGVGIPAAFTMGGSAIAAIIAEQSTAARLASQRATARQHVRILLDDVASQAGAHLLTEAGRCYQDAFDELRNAQSASRAARFEALASPASTGCDVTAWLDIQRQADGIAAQVSAGNQRGDRDLD